MIEWIRRRTGPHPRVDVGIGDDAAVLSWPTTHPALVAIDMLVENVHFDLSLASPEQVGHKALAVNLSDIAAMGGRPLAAVVSVALPPGSEHGLGQRLHEGLITLAEETNVALVGGDTTATDGPLVVSVTVIGTPLEGGPILRSGARPGDRLLVTGCLGNSRERHHLDFSPRLAESAGLVESGGLHAMIDISDGLAADLHHVLTASGVGARLHAGDIPIREPDTPDRDGRTPLAHAVADGEDFELLVAVEPRIAEQLVAAPPCGTPLSDIGEIVTGSGAELVMPNGHVVPLPPLGYEHRID
ncbi:MAG: thiamine-phosphate kinase [Planctomycetota bacterium]|nr:thiamine-phosphate kinase [Planctomycetota bacterium]